MHFSTTTKHHQQSSTETSQPQHQNATANKSKQKQTVDNDRLLGFLQPKVKRAQQGLKTNQQRQGAYYDRSTKDQDTLQLGDRVRIQPLDPHTVWRKGWILRQVVARSYDVQLHSDGVETGDTSDVLKD